MRHEQSVCFSVPLAATHTKQHYNSKPCRTFAIVFPSSHISKTHTHTKRQVAIHCERSKSEALHALTLSHSTTCQGSYGRVTTSTQQRRPHVSPIAERNPMFATQRDVAHRTVHCVFVLSNCTTDHLNLSTRDPDFSVNFRLYESTSGYCSTYCPSYTISTITNGNAASVSQAPIS